MQTRVTLLHLAALFTLISPIAGLAQKFQQPTREELEMTSDPKAPGAAAVYLDLQEVTDNYSHYVSQYARIKVLTEKGKEYATVEVPYVSGSSATPIIEARTIHPDGTVIPLTGKPADLLVASTQQGRLKAAVFNLPSVEVGSILEYKWTIPITEGAKVSGVHDDIEGLMSSALASSTPQWIVQRPIFAHKEHFYFNPFNSLETASDTGGANSISYYVDGELAKFLLFAPRLPAGAQVMKGGRNDYTLDLKDVPPITHEAYTPPLQGLSYHVSFYYSPYNSADSYWDNEGKRWSKRMDHFATPSGPVKDAATQIITGADTDEAKARKLYDAVQALDNTSFTREKSQSERQQLHLRNEDKTAQDVLAAKSGSDTDLAGLYLALVRAAGLQADAMSIADRRYRLFDPGLLSISQLAATVVVLHLNGKDVFTDPGEKFCPFGQLAWYHTLSGGLRQTPQGASHDSATPANLSKDAISSHTADITLDAEGNATGTVKFLLFGPEALHWRQLSAISDIAEARSQFSESLAGMFPSGINGELERFEGLDKPDTALVALVNVKGKLGSMTGKRLLLPAFFFSANSHPLFVSEEKRELPVDLKYSEQQIDDVTYHLPAGYTVESAPPSTQLPWPAHAALVVKVTPGSGTVATKRIFARAFVFLAPQDYAALRDYYQKVATSDAQQIVLTQGGA
jgi:hypothetical protein